MIRLGNEDVREDVVIRPGLRYGIVKVTNGTMTAHKGVWSWTARETYLGPRFALRSQRLIFRFKFVDEHIARFPFKLFFWLHVNHLKSSEGPDKTAESP